MSADGLVARLHAAIDEKQRQYEELVRDPFEGLSDDELHQRHAHRAYEYATTEGQRKAWDNEMDPPPGGGWELNITSADPEAWERFDYHEERYWRRARPDGPREWVPDQEAVHGLRLCQVHRDILAKYQKHKKMFDDLGDDPAYRGGEGHLLEAGLMSGLLAAVKLVARGYGVEDQ